MQGLSDRVQGFFNRQDAITRECSLAKTQGADRATLDEYRLIRRSLMAGKTMLNVLGQPKESIEKVLRMRQERLLVLQHQYQNPACRTLIKYRKSGFLENLISFVFSICLSYLHRTVGDAAAVRG